MIRCKAERLSNPKQMVHFEIHDHGLSEDGQSYETGFRIGIITHLHQTPKVKGYRVNQMLEAREKSDQEFLKTIDLDRNHMWVQYDGRWQRMDSYPDEGVA